jgi:hypothetical protein
VALRDFREEKVVLDDEIPLTTLTTFTRNNTIQEIFKLLYTLRTKHSK